MNSLDESMQETGFIDQNKNKWREIESLLSDDQRDPDRVTDLFIEASDDLSYARTNYPNRSVRVYLNGLVQQIYQRIYAKRSQRKGAFVAFWKEELPLVMYTYRRYLLYSFLVFSLGIGIGVLSNANYPDFASIVLGEDYVAMTEENIASGDPMAVYKSSSPLEMFFTIALNNIRVSFFMFVFGITFGVVTYYMLLYNGIILGAFIHFFIQRLLFKDAFLAVMLHGTIELSMIVLAGTAGLILGKGMVFPGTYKRTEALIITARAAIKVMIAVFFFLLIAAFIESFVTRITSLESVTNGSTVINIVRAVLIALSLLLVLGYFVWYPRRKFGNQSPDALHSEELGDTPQREIDITSIKPNMLVFIESYFIFARNAKSIVYFSLAFAALITIGYGWASHGNFERIYFSVNEADHFVDEILWVWQSYKGPLNFERFPWMFLVLGMALTAWFVYGGRLLRKQLSLSVSHSVFSEILLAATASLIVAVAFLLPGWATFLVMPLVLPTAIFVYAAFGLQKEPGAFPISDLFAQIFGQLFRVLFLYAMLLALQWLCFTVTNSQLVMQVIDIVNLNVSGYLSWSNQLIYGVYTFILFFVVPIILCTSYFAFSLQFFSLREIQLALGLRKRIEQIAQRRKAYGLERE